MNDGDMAQLALKPGDRATVRSAHGEMSDVRVQPFGLPAGNILAYYPEANVLIGTERDPRSQTPAFKSVPVAVCGVEEDKSRWQLAANPAQGETA